MGNFNRTDDHRDNRDAGAGGKRSQSIGRPDVEDFNPSLQDVYWREAHAREPYYRRDFTYDDYAPAYRTGYETAGRYRGMNKGFDDVESELRDQYERIKGKSRLAWDDARMAAKAAWHRVERILPGDLDDDGR